LIYTESGWAIYHARLVDLPQGKASLEIVLKHQQPIEFDLRIGLISIVSSFILPPEIGWIEKVVKENKIDSCISSTELKDVLLSWKINDIKCIFRVFRDNLLVGVVKTPLFLDK
jgi:hypothetical protein